jgi:hypothetical protein
MSKQSDAKAAQNWRKEPDGCGNCTQFAFDVVTKEYKAFDGLHIWVERKNKRCLLGGFATGDKSTCDLHELKTAPVAEAA